MAVSIASIFSLTFVILGSITYSAADINEVLSTKDGSKVCVGKICDDSNAFWYFECCGDLYNDCCFRFQTWIIVILVVLGLLMLASFIIGLIRCICCCDR